MRGMSWSLGRVGGGARFGLVSLVALVGLSSCDPRALRYVVQGAGGAGGGTGCDDGTISVEVTLDPVAAAAVLLTVRVGPLGGATAVTSVAHTPGIPTATIVARLPDGATSSPADVLVVVIAAGAVAAPLPLPLPPPLPLGSGSASATAGGAAGGICPSVAVAVGARAVDEFGPPPNRKLDMIFVVDRSPGMETAQIKFLAQFPVFTNVLKMLPTLDGMHTALPDLHLAVVSSDTGPGRYDLPGRSCPFGGDRGLFQYAARGDCMVSPLDTTPTQQTFLAASNDQQQKNYRGDITDAFTCIARLGSQGCAFSSPLEALRWALDPVNPVAGNQGFLRPDAILAVVLLTNQDDCSVPEDSSLMDPTQDALSDPLGPFSTFRCNEFGHLCQVGGGLQPPPRTVPTWLTGCVSNDTATGRLTRVADEVAFLRGLKRDPNQIFVVATTGPASPYGIALQNRSNRFGVAENQPQMIPSCTVPGTAEYGLPAVRIEQWVTAFGDRGLLQPVCGPTFAPALQAVAQDLGKVENDCMSQRPRDVDPTTPALDADCIVTDHSSTDPAFAGGLAVPACAGNGGKPPCWTLSESSRCDSKLAFDVTRADEPPSDIVTTVSCATCPAGVAAAGCP
jgi:hypothetical protein